MPDTVIALDSTKSILVGNVVVSSSRWNEDSRMVPREISRVDARDIAIKNPSTTADAIAQTGVVHVQKSQLGGGSPMLRGYSANAVLMVIDGIRINNAIYRGGNLQNVLMVDASSLSSAEVLFGPGSVQYGSDALGGVMNFRTKEPLFAPRREKTLSSGNAFIRYGSAAGEVSASVSFDLANRKVASSTVVSASTFGDLAGGASFMDAYPEFGRRPWYVNRFDGQDSVVTNPDDYIQIPTGYEQYNIIQNLSIKLSSDETLRYTGLFTTSTDIPRFDRLLQEQDSLPRFSEWYYGPQLWTLHAFTYSSKIPSIFADEYAVVGSFQYYQESRNDRRFDVYDIRERTEEVWIGAVNVDAKKSLAWRKLQEFDLYYGLEGYINDVSSSAASRNIFTQETTPITTRYPDGGSFVQSLAFYAQTRLGLSESLSLAAGVRYTLYGLSASVKDSSQYPFPADDLGFTTSAFSGSAGLTWLPTRTVSLHTNISSGFRAPNVDDVAKIFDSAPGVLVIPNANLRPENALTLEAGIEWTPVRRTTFNINGYRTWSTNAIERRPTTINGMDTVIFDDVPSAVFTNVNVGQANIYGLNAAVNINVFDPLELTATASWNDGRDITNDLPLRHVPPVFGSAQLRWFIQKFTAGVEFWWAAAKPFNELPPEEQAKVGINYTRDGTPAWRRIDITARYAFANNFALNLRLDNILDLNYKTFASAISSPGRNFVMTVRWGW